jgi:hypothetical protein
MSHDRQMGDAESTVAANKAATRLFNVWRDRNGRSPLSNMQWVEVEEDNLEAEIFNFCRWVSSTPIPKFFDDQLKPRLNNSNQEGTVKLLLKSTLTKYVGKVILMIRNKFPQHPDFASLHSNSDVPLWWTKLRPIFERECDRYHLRLDSEQYAFGETATCPLYITNSSFYIPVDEGLVNDYISLIDLRYILMKLMHEASIGCDRNGKLQQRCWLIFAYQAVGRGGEIKFQDYNNWMWHPKYEIVDIGWTELKLLTKYAMAMVPHKNHFFMDWYHGLGSYWSVEQGLHRSSGDRQIIGNYVFPDLHAFSDPVVTKKVTQVIRENLPKGCPEEIAQSFSAKSTHKGSITLLATHHGCDVLDVCGRSGHATGTSLDSYMDMSYIPRSLPGAKILNQYTNLQADIKVPRLECLAPDTHDSVNRLIDSLFVVSIAKFKRGGELHIVLRTCAASLVMYHKMVTQELGTSNAVATKLRNAARNAGITDSRFPNTPTEFILDQWSELIWKDFNDRNPEMAIASADMSQIALVLNQNNQVLMEMKTMLVEVSKVQANAHAYMSSQAATIRELHNEINSLQRNLQRAEQKLRFLKTPPSSSQSQQRSRRRYKEIEEEDIELNINTKIAPLFNEGDEISYGSSSSNSSSNKKLQTTMTKSIPQRPLLYSAEAKKISEDKTNKDFFLSRCMKDLYERNLLSQKKWSNIQVPALYEEKHFLKSTLELVEVVITDEDKNVLKNPGATAEWLADFGSRIEDQCMAKMQEYEGSEITKSKGKMKATYMALGRRVKAYKKELAKLTQNHDPYKELLRDRPKAVGPATPQDNRSMLGFMQKKQRK